MPKAKEKQEVVNGPDVNPSVTPEVQLAPKPVEKLLEFTIVTSFHDGNLQQFFEKYGYSAEWPAGQKRLIPKSLAQRVLNSGGRLFTKNGEELSLW